MIFRSGAALPPISGLVRTAGRASAARDRHSGMPSRQGCQAKMRFSVDLRGYPLQAWATSLAGERRTPSAPKEPPMKFGLFYELSVPRPLIGSGPGMQENLLKVLLAVSEGHGEEAADIVIRMSERTDEFKAAEFRRRISQLVA